MGCLICAKSSGFSTHDPHLSNKIVTKFMEQLPIKGERLTLDQLLLCDDCFSGVGKAVEWRDQVGEVERDVRSLQRIILKMMRQLKSLQGNYLEEMRRLERKIRSCRHESSALENSRGGQRNSHQKKADTFRQGILNVVVDLGIFQETRQHHLCPQTIPDPNAAPPPPFLMENVIIKRETESAQVECLPSVALEEEFQDPLFTEDIDIEHGIYSADLAINEPLQRDNDVTASSVAEDSSSSVVCQRKKIGKNPSSNESTREFGPCQFCGKMFNKSTNLKAHIQTHTGERPHKCHLCHRAFTQKKTLDRHRLTHSEKKPFSCPECGKGFGRKDALEGHRISHRAEKPFVCRVCGNGYTSNQKMRHHIRNKHPNHNANNKVT